MFKLFYLLIYIIIWPY